MQSMAVAWANACIKLLQGIVYDDDPCWNMLSNNIREITDFFETIDVQVFIDQNDGYAFLKQIDDDASEAGSETIRLIRRYPLSFELSLLCVLLREELEKFDSSQHDSAILVLSESEIRSMLSVYFKEKADQTKLYRELTKYLNQAAELSFLKELKENSGSTDIPVDRKFEVRRILRAVIDIDFLTEFKKRLDHE